MTPDVISRFRGFFLLHQIQITDSPEARFAALVSVAKWVVAEKRNPGPENDALLSPAGDDADVYMGLLLWLATIDRSFFNLAKRMAARTLVKHQPVAETFLVMAYHLLMAGEGPKHSRPTAARNVAIVLAISVGTKAGWTPTESHWSTGHPTSGCGKAAALLGMERDAIEKVWIARKRWLTQADFSEHDVSEFFSDFVG